MQIGLMLDAAIKERIERDISSLRKKPVIIKDARPAGGGCINRAYTLDTNGGYYFLKANCASLFPGMFELEMRGLKMLSEAGEIHVPIPICSGTEADTSFLLLEFISSSEPAGDFWETFGRSLARLHKHTSPYFGLDHDNYIGSLKQSNNSHDKWATFFITERIMPLIRLAVDRNKLDYKTERQFSLLFTKLNTLLPEEPPSLLHGDLWNGNYMVNKSGCPSLIDPAVYHGSREMDLGMSLLFGGFPREFYASYHEEFPMLPGWEERTELCNLYPLMVHVILFGGSYSNSVQGILNKYM